jgi:hypothetical protein
LKYAKEVCFGVAYFDFPPKPQEHLTTSRDTSDCAAGEKGLLLVSTG